MYGITGVDRGSAACRLRRGRARGGREAGLRGEKWQTDGGERTEARGYARYAQPILLIK